MQHSIVNISNVSQDIYDMDVFDKEKNFIDFASHIKYNKYYKYERILSFYSLFLTIIGTICNLTSFIVMHHKNMRKYTCMRILAILSLSDLFVLYQWNFNMFFQYNLTRPPLYRDLEELSLFGCRWIGFFAFSCLQASAWLLSFLSIDRLMTIYSSWWTRIMKREVITNAIIYSIVLFIMLLNSHLVFLNGYTIYENVYNETLKLNQTIEKVICYKSINDPSYINPKWQYFHFFAYSIFPFSIMLLCNSIIILNVVFCRKIESKSKRSVSKKRHLTFMLILVTFSFIFLTAPSVILHSFFRSMLKTKPYKRLCYMIVSNLLHSSHAINFFLYIYSSPNFRNEFLNLFKLFQKKNELRRARTNIDKQRKTDVRRVKTLKNSTFNPILSTSDLDVE